jgi:hypothetical protein
MFRKDFETGRFPISKRSPVIGYGKSGITVAYNRSDLGKMAGIPEIVLVGIWPGKKNTDLFHLNAEAYKRDWYVPRGHEDIDSAESIVITYNGPNSVDYITYHFPEQIPIICKDPALAIYIKEAGIRHTVSFGEAPCR